MTNAQPAVHVKSHNVNVEEEYKYFLYNNWHRLNAKKSQLNYIFYFKYSYTVLSFAYPLP